MSVEESGAPPALSADLAERERRLRAIIETEPECVKVVSPEGRLLEMNPAGLAMLEAASLANVQACPLLEFIDPGYRAAFLALHRRVMAGERGTLEFEVVGLKGGRRRLETHAAPLCGPAGEVTALLGITRDVSERHRAESALRAANARLHMVVDSSPLAIYTRDRDGLVTSWNPAAEAMFGWRAAEVLGQPLPTVPPEQRSASDALRERLLAGETFIKTEGERCRRDGSAIHIESFLAPLRDGTGAVEGIIAMVADVTERKRAEAALRASEATRRAIIDSALDAIITVDAGGRVIEFNPAAEAIFGYAREAAAGRALADLVVPPQLRRAHLEGFAAHRAGGGGHVVGRRVEMPAMRADGSQFPVELAITAIASQEGGVYAGFVRDITARKAAEERIRALNRVYAVLSGINGLIVRVRSREELFREACRIAVEKGGFRMAWIGNVDAASRRIVPQAWHGTGLEYIELLPLGLEPGPPALYGLPGIAANERRAVISDDLSRDPRVLLRRESLERRVCSMAMLPLVLGEEAVGVLALYASETGFFTAEEMRLLEELAGDIAFALEHLRKDAAVHALANYDPLTGLANRALLIERLGERLAAARDAGHQAALALVNIERFRAINDAYGRAQGDALLRAVARRLAAFAGEANVARVGADQFAVVVPRVRRTEALARRLREGNRRLDAEPYTLAGAELRISSRAGVALFPGDAADAETLFLRAEAALKRAQPGEPVLFYAGEMTARLAERVALETELRLALERGEFVLHYQPKFSVPARRLTGLEALLRWRSPARGLVPPAQFIAVLEETGLVLEAGAWALAEAARQRREWSARGLRPPRIAVNVSPLQLRRPDFAARLREALCLDAAPAGIDIEITESAVLHGLEATIARLAAARALGVRIAIDDFGTGYSSLAYLARLPLDTLKIDRSFVERMLDDAATMTLVRTLVSLAHSLGLAVVAEGVETAAQASALGRAGCDELQGYLLGRPLPAADTEALLGRPPARRGRRRTRRGNP